MTNHYTDSAPFKAAFQVTKPNGNRGAAEFSQSERLVFLGFTLMKWEHTESVQALWCKASSLVWLVISFSLLDMQVLAGAFASLHGRDRIFAFSLTSQLHSWRQPFASP
ncbi:hypothetical protein [Pseudomonas sp. R151218B TE3479]